jgi:signal transduction histidine kinase
VLETIAVIARPALEHAERLESLRESDDMNAAVLASVAHDFRTPLSTGMGVIELLGEGAEAGEDGPYLFELLRSSLTRIERIVESLLDLQRYELGRLPEPADANFAAVVADVVSSIGAAAEITVTGDAALRARIDVPALERVVENLVANSVKHAPGSPVRVIYERDDRGLISIVVEDDGPGVPSDGDIFAPFNQGDRASGTGLGLWIARTFVEGRGGRIRVGEAAGGGAAFHVELPPAP